MENKLGEIQQKLKAPKSQFNKFGNYKYRNAEDILEALKKVMPDDCALIIEDEIIQIDQRFYVKAKATLLRNGNSIASATAYAREPETKKGMDEAQITGATSSYARKYALNGLLLIDDTKDADSDCPPKVGEEKKPIIVEPRPLPQPKKKLTKKEPEVDAKAEMLIIIEDMMAESQVTEEHILKYIAEKVPSSNVLDCKKIKDLPLNYLKSVHNRFADIKAWEEDKIPGL